MSTQPEAQPEIQLETQPETQLETTPQNRTEDDVARRTSPLIAWALVIGGALFFAGGPLHPHEDPPDVTVKEHLHAMFEDPAWYPSHTLLLAGMAVTAFALVRAGTLAAIPRLQTAALVAAAAACLGTPAMLLHLLGALDADRIARHQSTPLTDVQVVVETVTIPFFGLAMAALAVLGATSRALGNLVTAVIGAAGGVGYALAGATFLFTDALDALFPAAAGIAIWTFATGMGLLLRRRKVAITG